MERNKSTLLSSTTLHLVLGAGLIAGGTVVAVQLAPAATVARDGVNPPAVARPNTDPVRIAACNPCKAKACNPCAAKAACSPCNPCAAKKACNPCNPCAAKKK